MNACHFVCFAGSVAHNFGGYCMKDFDNMYHLLVSIRAPPRRIREIKLATSIIEGIALALYREGQLIV
jgi:hypothetical protein